MRRTGRVPTPRVMIKNTLTRTLPLPFTIWSPKTHHLGSYSPLRPIQSLRFEPGINNACTINHHPGFREPGLLNVFCQKQTVFQHTETQASLVNIVS